MVIAPHLHRLNYLEEFLLKKPHDSEELAIYMIALRIILNTVVIPPDIKRKAKIATIGEISIIPSGGINFRKNDK